MSEARAASVQQILSAKTGQPERFSAEGRSDIAAGLERYNRGPRTQSSGRNHSIGGGGRVKAFFSFIIRWVIPLLGLIALSLIIWFVGPLFEFLVPEGRRGADRSGVWVVWIAYRVFHIIQARRQAAEVMRSLAAQTPPDPTSIATAEELETLPPAHGRSPGAVEESQAGW